MPSKKELRKTKIVCTIGPATAEPEMMGRLIDAGMDVARLNFSHGDREEHRQTIRLLRRAAQSAGREVGILQDLCGPKIRLGRLPVEERLLKNGEQVVLAALESSESEVIPVNYPSLAEEVSSGDRILLADGLVELLVEAVEGERVVCKVVAGGPIRSQKGVNLPSSSLKVPAFTDKDRADLEVGLAEGVDFVALSFVRHEQDLKPLREILDRMDSPPMLIAKIEKPQAIERVAEILASVDGVMIARGDMGVEMPLEQVPLIQKEIIRQARQAGKPVITATQMLRSMVENPRPSRAEATDVANAILDGTDAVMLSEETAVGNFPIEAVRFLARVAKATEPVLDSRAFLHEPLSEMVSLTEAAISRSACWLARDVEAAAIVACTSSGATPRLVARFRPARPIIGLTPSLMTCRQLRLTWGVLPKLAGAFDDTEHMLSLSRTEALAEGLADSGDRLVITAGVPVGVPGTTNLLKVLEID